MSSYFSTGSSEYVSRDRHTTFAECYPPGEAGFSAEDGLGVVRNAIRAATPSGVEVHVNGVQAPDVAVFRSDVDVTKDVVLEAPSGTRVAGVGENGVGKSTLPQNLITTSRKEKPS